MHCFLYRLFAFSIILAESQKEHISVNVVHNVNFKLFSPKIYLSFTFICLLINLFGDFLKNAYFYLFFFPDTTYVTQ